MKNLFTLAALCAVSPSFLLMPDGGAGGGGACLDTLGLPKWQSHKTVCAAKINALTDKEGIPALEICVLSADEAKPFVVIAVGQAWLDRHKPEVGGYFVLYQDGYRSYSPAEAFEEGNTPAYVPGDHQGKIGYETFRTHLAGTPNVAPMPGWDDLAKHEATAPFARSWNRAAQAIAATVMSNLREYFGPEPSEDPALDLGVNEISNLIHLFENRGSGYRIIKPAGEAGGEDTDLSPEVAVSLRTILATLGRDVVGYPTPGTIEPKGPPAPSVSLGDPRALETAWGIIANVSGGDWNGQNSEWVTAAEKFRDEIYYPALENLGTLRPGQAPCPAVDALSYSVDGVPVMRARLLVIGVCEEGVSEGGAQEIEMIAVGPAGLYPDTGLDPDSTFSKWTPSANLKMKIANPALFNAIQRGDKFAVDFVRISRESVPAPNIPAPKPTPADAQPGGEKEPWPGEAEALAEHFSHGLQPLDKGKHWRINPHGNEPEMHDGDAPPGIPTSDKETKAAEYLEQNRKTFRHAGHIDVPPNGEPATITHLAAKDAAGNDVPTPQNDDVPPGGPVPTPETAEAPKS